MKTYKAKSTNDLPEIAKNIINEFNNEKIFALYGEMGSGKTTFIKEICKYLDGGSIEFNTNVGKFTYNCKFGDEYNGKLFRGHVLDEPNNIIKNNELIEIKNKLIYSISKIKKTNSIFLHLFNDTIDTQIELINIIKNIT